MASVEEEKLQTLHSVLGCRIDYTFMSIKLLQKLMKMVITREILSMKEIHEEKIGTEFIRIDPHKDGLQFMNL